MHTIEYLPHIADVRIRLEADSINELFEAGVKSIIEILKPQYCDDVRDFSIWHSIELKSRNITLLLVDFLSEVLTLCHMEKVLFCEFNINVLDNSLVKATIGGLPVDGFGEDIKAITYHEAEVKKNKNGNWETILVIDI